MPIAQVNGQGLSYEDSGGTGPALLFMHGFLMDQSMFDPQVAALAPRYRCIRFDARGFGQTQWDGHPFSLYDTAADAVGLLDCLGIQQATIIGMSQGGYATLRLALRYPERVKALVLMSTQAGADPEEGKAQFYGMRDTWKSVGPVPPLVEGVMTLIIGPQSETAALWQEWTPKWQARTGDQIFHAMNNLLDRDDITPAQVGQITAPALVTHGDADLGMPIELGEQLAQHLPNCKGFVRIPGAAHAANLTHPQIINPPLVAFLAEYA